MGSGPAGPDVSVNSGTSLTSRASLVAQTVKNLPAIQFDPWVGKIPWGRKLATHSSILAWKIPWTEEPGGL